MTATNLTAAGSVEQQEERKNKKPLKIRISIFFDGTLNNRENIEEREKNSDIYKKNKTNDGVNSYDNGRTNIAIMEPHVITEKTDYAGNYDFVYKSYIAGQGALSGEEDTVWGYALAIGKSGVPNRAEEGINKAVGFILGDTKNINPLENYIEKLTIDVFGFSRGAATARYAIHVLFNGRISRIDDETGEVYYEWKPFFQRLNDFRYDINEADVEVCFAGLYDTVLSYIGSQKLPWSSNVLQQKAVARAKKVLHLVAADEHRKDFPLHNIDSAVKKGVGEEYYLPGVHSDVGGSYNKANEIQLQKEADENKKVYMLPSNEGLDIKEGKKIGDVLVLNEGTDRDRLEKDRNDLIQQGWYLSDEIKIAPKLVANSTNLDDTLPEYTLSARRQGISSAYCNIPLKIMAEYARKPEVKLKVSEKLEDRAQIILKHEDDLKDLEEKIRSYMSSTKHSKAEDWIAENEPRNNSQLKRIRHKHFHFSAKPGVGYSPRFVWDETAWKFRRERYIYEA